MSPVIRRAVPTDVAELTRCQTACYREAFASVLPADFYADSAPEHRRRATWVEFLDAGGTAWIALDGAAAVGFATSGPSRGADPPLPVELIMLYVRATHHGSGLADRLLTGAIGTGPAMLWCWEGNSRAQAYYAKHGFVADGGQMLTPESVRLLRFVRS
jgi:GNAT superfamily N-acetyltransferase